MDDGNGDAGGRHDHNGGGEVVILDHDDPDEDGNDLEDVEKGFSSTSSSSSSLTLLTGTWIKF